MTANSEPETFSSRNVTLSNVWTGTDHVPDTDFGRFEELARASTAVAEITEIKGKARLRCAKRDSRAPISAALRELNFADLAECRYAAQIMHHQSLPVSGSGGKKPYRPVSRLFVK